MNSKDGQITVKIVDKIPSGDDEVSLFEAIGLLSQLAGKNTPESYEARLHIHDPLIRVNALINLINSPNFSTKKIQLIVHVCKRSAYLRTLLVPILADKLRFDLVDVLIEAEKAAQSATSQLTEKLFDAQLNNDYEAQASLYTELYFQTGNNYYLEKLSVTVKERLPWQKAWVYLLRLIFVAEPENVERLLLLLFTTLEQADARNEFKLFAKHARDLKNCAYPVCYAISQVKFWDGEYKECLEYMKNSNLLELSKDKTSLICTLAARCYEKLKDYENAAYWYGKQNAVLAKTNKFTPEEFIWGIDERAKLQIPHQPEGDKDNYFIMCGFPRSGTTLLENALSAHPRVATCEESSSLLGAARVAYLSPLVADPDIKDFKLRTKLFRELYYKNLDRHSNQKDADVIIDKTPIISANIEFMEKAFAHKRYIFSIRHPYDVVISNFKQSYAQNAAMSAFNDMHAACILYNKVMSTWFNIFPTENDRVFYVKYDTLVTDFENTLTGALDFLGVGWADEVLDFVEHSKKRAVRTPSYVNVRKGLSIGVQSSWKNYSFMFDDKCRELLDPWVERFGYSLE